jgi:DNA-binding response OmpR family regulator
VKHVLVVDDEEPICALLREALGGEGRYLVTCVARGLDALWHFENDRPDLAIIDVRLPDMSGVRLAKRALERGITVLLITGHGDAQGILRGCACPMLPKPFRVAELLSRVLALTIDDTQHQQHVRAALGGMPEA